MASSHLSLSLEAAPRAPGLASSPEPSGTVRPAQNSAGVTRGQLPPPPSGLQTGRAFEANNRTHFESRFRFEVDEL